MLNNFDWQVALFEAAARGNMSEIEQALRMGAKADAKDRRGWNALHHAMSKFPDVDKTAIIRRLLELGADPNMQNRYGDTPLHMAAAWQTVHREQYYNILIAAGGAAGGANPEIRNIQRLGLQTPQAILHDYQSKKKQASNQVNFDCQRALFEAAASGDISKMEAMLRLGAQVNAQDHLGWNALHHAIVTHLKMDKTAIIQRLLELGADPNMADIDGNSPYIMAVSIMYDSVYGHQYYEILDKASDRASLAASVACSLPRP